MENLFVYFHSKKNLSEFLVEQRVKISEQRAKGNEQQARSNDQQTKCNKQRATRKKFGLSFSRSSANDMLACGLFRKFRKASKCFGGVNKTKIDIISIPPVATRLKVTWTIL